MSQKPKLIESENEYWQAVTLVDESGNPTGGGGGGDASASNQTLQITEAESTNTKLDLQAKLTDTQPVSLSSVPLPADASTESKQDISISSLASILTQQQLTIIELQKKANLIDTQPVSLSITPLPTDASTESKQDLQIVQETEINNKLLQQFDFSYNASGGQRVSQSTTLLDGKVIGEDDVELFENVGTGTATYSDNKINLSVTAGQYIIRQSKRFTPYFSGKSQLVEFTFDNFQGETDVTKRVGYFSSDAVAPYNATLDGIYLEDVNGIKYLVCERNGTETIRIAFTSMSNYSAISAYDWENFSVCAVDFLWLGGAVIRFFVKTQTGFELIHTENYSGTQKDVFILSPNQPIRYEIRSTGGSGSFRYVCCQIATEGSINESGKTLAVYNLATVTTNNVGTIYALKGIKKQVAFRDTAVQIIEMSAISEATNDSGLLMVIKNPTLSAPLVYSNVKKIQQADGTGQTITPGTGWVVGAIPKGREAGASSVLKDNFLAFLSHEIDNTMDEYVLAFLPYTSNQKNAGVLTVKIF